jgi:GT2 family glycosyltransferase
MVSVIVCFHERVQHLLRCLDALELNREYFDEVVISDDGSKPETVAAVKAELDRYSFPIEYAWRKSERFELAAARNQGVRAAKGDYLVIYDCDFLSLPDTIKTHVALRKRGRFVAGRCKYLSEGETDELFAQEPLTAEYLETLYAKQSDAELRKLNFRYARRNLLTRLKLASAEKHSIGSHISIYRDDLEKVNGYDENYVGWGGEDNDLGKRLVAAGIMCIPALTKARLMHMWHPKELGDKDWAEGANVEYYQRKNRLFRCANGLVDETGKDL